MPASSPLRSSPLPTTNFAGASATTRPPWRRRSWKRWRALRGRVPGVRKDDFAGEAVRVDVLQDEFGMVLFGDPPGDRQPEAAARFLGAAEPVEAPQHALFLRARNPGAVVAHDHHRPPGARFEGEF